MIRYYETHQSTDRIARIVINVLICRAFLRSVYGVVYRPVMGHYRPQSEVPTAY